MNIWQFILKELSDKKACMLLLVAESAGSSPGRQGFKMAVTADGNMSGSIGGGIMEHKLVTLSLDLLKKGSKVILRKQQIHNKTSKQNQSGMICSGEQTIIMVPLYNVEFALIERIYEASQKINTDYFQVNANSYNLIKGTATTPPFQLHNLQESNWSFAEKLHRKKIVHIIGGGHVGCALSTQMSLLGFHVRNYDNRKELNTMIQNDAANEKLVIDYEAIENYIAEGDQQFVVIMSFGYRDDKLVLKALYKKHFAYIGMMGSKAKIRQLYQELNAEGISNDDLKHVHAPIGVGIASKTPAEIAVSIAAQIIGVKNG